MPKYLLDCNHLSVAINRVSPLRDRIQRTRRTGSRFVACYPVLCELEVGILQTPSPDENYQRLTRLLNQVRIWPLDGETTRLYGAIYIELRKRGRILSQVDMMLAALARQHKLTLLTTDRDFEALPDLKVENWVA
jgi:tRNA(fMet)-specific endonuclease VapC